MRTFAVLCVVGLGVAVSWPARPAAAPKPSNPGVTVTFADRAGDKIKSDGHGSYVNGVGGVVGQIFVSGSGDMTLNLKNTRPNRVFNGDYTPATDADPISDNPPSGTFTNGSFINIPRIWQMTVGETSTRGAAFNAAVGSFRWCLDPAKCGGAATDVITVTRTAFDKWTATADPASATTIRSDLSVLLKMPSVTAVAFYHMPFQLTIQCKTSTCQ